MIFDYFNQIPSELEIREYKGIKVFVFIIQIISLGNFLLQ